MANSANIARSDSYGSPPLSKGQRATSGRKLHRHGGRDRWLQLTRADIRPASVLNKSLGSEQTVWTD
jgi:hypothetical protein